jgi:hypothetical protein
MSQTTRPGAILLALGLSLFAPAAPVQTHDDLLLRVEKLLPGFGGMFLAPDGRLAVFLLDLARLPAARPALEAVFGPSIIPPAGLRALPGQYTVSQLKRWSDAATQLLTRPGVTLVDLDESRNRVVVGLAPGAPLAPVRKALAARRIPPAAVLIERRGEFRQLDSLPPDPTQ